MIYYKIWQKGNCTKLYNFKLKGWDGGSKSSKARKDKEMIYWFKMYSFALNITVIKIM